MADASVILGPVIDRIINSTASLIKEEYLLVQGVKTEVQDLSSKLSSVKAVLKDAEEKQVNDSHVKDWLGKLNEAALDAEDILDTFAADSYRWNQKQKVRKVPLPLSKSKISYKLDAAHKIKDILKRFDMINQDKEDFHLNVQADSDSSQSDSDSSPKIQNRTDTIHSVDNSSVVGREDDKESIVNMLLSDAFNTEGDISVIPIIGMGGLGKTTLAQLLFNDERISKHFDSRMWVCVTANFDLKRILREMIQFHSKMKYDDSFSVSLLESRLLEFLAGQRFLLVLDDVWTEDYSKWEPLQVILKKGGNGSRVLVTSRSTGVNNVIGTQPPHLLGYLPDDQCWSLFEKIALKNCNLPSKTRKGLEDIGRLIVSKCKGLPLAVKALAGILRGNYDVNKWGQIKDSEIWEIEDQKFRTDKPKILSLLKLSYDHLPANLKPCFAYCSIFPKAYVFDKKELVKLWMAEGFIESEGQQTTEEIGIEYFSELFMRSFFQVANIDQKEIYSMHDLIQDLAQSISSPSICHLKDKESCTSSQQARHLSLLKKDVEQPLLEIVDNSPKLRTLLLPSDHIKNFGKALDKVFHKLNYLRVLDLSSSMLLELPNSIKELKLLRYLDLSRTEIKVLPDSVCKLYNLQTLKLLGCIWLFELPKELSHLINLRHLELDELFWFKSSMLPPRMGNLTGLHNLHSFQVGLEIGYGIGELKNMACLSGTLHISKLENAMIAKDAKLNEKKSLHKVVFEWSERVANARDEVVEERLLEDLQPHSNLEVLQICQYRGTRFPLWITDGQLQNLVSVTLNGCTKCKSLTLDQLPQLQGLFLKSMQELEKLTMIEFPSLHSLKFSNCPKLMELPKFFPKLRVMKIKKCNSLRALPVAPSLMFLILVGNLVLENWGEVVVQFISENDEGKRKTWRQPSLVNLLELKVIRCPKLEALPQHFAPQKLEISGCELLTTLPIPQMAQRLQHLALDACHDGTLVRAIPNSSSLYSLVISNISNLFSLPKWPHLPALKALYIRGCKDLVSLSKEEEGSLHSLTSVKLLSIQDCPCLVTINERLPTTLECLNIGSCPHLQSLGQEEILKSLTSLKDLYIEDCPMLESLPEDGLPGSLQHMQIQGCMLLTKQCQKEDGVGPNRPKIMDIPDLEIDPPKVSTASPPVVEAKTKPKISFWPIHKNKANSIKASSKETSKQASCRPQPVDEEEETSLIPRAGPKNREAPKEEHSKPSASPDTKELENSSVAATTTTSETTRTNSPASVKHDEEALVEFDEDDMKSFYESLGANLETSQLVSSSTTTDVQSKKTRPDQSEINKALDMVKIVLATDFSSAYHPGRSTSLKSALELLCGLDENDGISVEMKSFLLQLSKDFKELTNHFNQANETIERCTNLINSKAKIASQMNENKEQFSKLTSVESIVQKSISEAKLQINELQQKIDSLKSPVSSLTEQKGQDNQEKETMSTVQKSNFEAEAQINELQQKIDTLKSHISSLDKQKQQEMKTIFTNGKKLMEKLAEETMKAGNSEKEKEVAEKMKKEIEDNWLGYKKKFETFTCNKGH